jgi:hypothetical protein
MNSSSLSHKQDPYQRNIFHGTGDKMNWQASDCEIYAE